MALGMNRYEARSYLALLTEPSQKASDVARRARVPLQKVYEVLESLSVKGFCRVVSSDIKQFSAVNPDLAITGYIDSIERELQEDFRAKRDLASSLSTLLESAYSKGRQSSDPRVITVVKGTSQVGAWFMKFLLATKTEYLEISRPPYIFTPFETLEHIRNLNDTGKTVRLIIERGQVSDAIAPFLEQIKPLELVTVRFAAIVPVKLALFDRTRGMIALTDDESGVTDFTALVFQREELNVTLRSVFDDYWTRAIDQ